MEGRLMAEVDRPLWSPAPLISASQRDRRSLLRPDVLPVVLVLVATAALIVALKLTVAGFGSIGQLTAILVTAIFLVVASFGQGLVILTGGIDLSIGAVMGIGGMIVANLTRGVDDALIYALPVALLCCTGIGVINGLGVAIGRLPPFIMTLSSSTAFFGVALGMTAGSSQQSVAPALQRFMAGSWFASHFHPPIRCDGGPVPEPQCSRPTGLRAWRKPPRRRHPRLASGGTDGHRLCAERLMRGRRRRAARRLLVERDARHG